MCGCVVTEYNDGVFTCHESEYGPVLKSPDVKLSPGVGGGHRKNVTQERLGGGAWREGRKSLVGEEIAEEK